MNTHGHFVHPEILSQVNDEFKLLYVKYPDTDGVILWGMARDYVFAMSLADSMIFKIEMGLVI